MVKSFGKYMGQKHCEITHEPSGAVIHTDAPKDNNGLGLQFSPTDLLAAALGSCMMTVMGIQADKDNISLEGSHYEVSKIMVGPPRKIGKLDLEFHMPANLQSVDRQNLEKIALNCPVKLSLNTELVVNTVFHYDI